jgi:hypothetical protein
MDVDRVSPVVIPVIPVGDDQRLLKSTRFDLDSPGHSPVIVLIVSGGVRMCARRGRRICRFSIVHMCRAFGVGAAHHSVRQTGEVAVVTRRTMGFI